MFLFVAGVAYTKVANAMILFLTATIWTAVMTILMGKEKARWLKLLGDD